MRLSSWIQQYSLCVYWPVPSLVAAGVLLHIWNLPNEMTRKQSCCSERCCSRSGIHSPVAAVLRQIWHILIFAKILHDSRVPQSLRSQVSGLRLISQTLSSFFSVFVNVAISEIWSIVISSSTYDFSPTNEAQFLDTAVSSMCLLTRTQSRSSRGVAPHLESSERNDT